jgi:hypothetical protein
MHKGKVRNAYKTGGKKPLRGLEKNNMQVGIFSVYKYAQQIADLV